MYFINLLMEAVSISEVGGDTKERKEKLRERVAYALDKKLIDKQDVEEINEIAGLKIFE